MFPYEKHAPAAVASQFATDRQFSLDEVSRSTSSDDRPLGVGVGDKESPSPFQAVCDPRSPRCVLGVCPLLVGGPHKVRLSMPRTLPGVAAAAPPKI